MKVCKYILLLLTLMISLCSCTAKENDSIDIYSQIYEKYKDIKSYKGIVDITIASNKTENNYTVKQYYKSPNMYRTEIIKPEVISSLTTICNGDEVMMVFPEIYENQTMNCSNCIGESHIFLTDFFSSYYKSEQTAVETMNNDYVDCTVLNADIPGGNIYRFTETLWIDNASLLPTKMEVYDIKDNPVISVIFKEIEFDVEIEDVIFENTGG